MFKWQVLYLHLHERLLTGNSKWARGPQLVDLNYKRLILHQLVHHCLHIIPVSGRYQSTEHVHFRTTVWMEIIILAFRTGNRADHFHHIAGLSYLRQLRPHWYVCISFVSLYNLANF